MQVTFEDKYVSFGYTYCTNQVIITHNHHGTKGDQREKGNQEIEQDSNVNEGSRYMWQQEENDHRQKCNFQDDCQCNTSGFGKRRMADYSFIYLKGIETDQTAECRKKADTDECCHVSSLANTKQVSRKAPTLDSVDINRSFSNINHLLRYLAEKIRIRKVNISVKIK